MSIQGSLNNALSGLTAQARAAELVSSNVANSTTEGYARRDLALSPKHIGNGTPGGVRVVGVQRDVDMTVVQNRRLADAAVGYDSTRSEFYARLADVLGTPEDAGSLSGRMDALETALIEAGSRPDNDARLSGVLSAATGVTRHLNTASGAVQDLRMQADRDIADQVRRLNDGLTRVQTLNYQITAAAARGEDNSALLDIRQQTVDSLSSIVPMKQVDRDHGMIALYTTGGAILLDGKAAEVGFDPVGTIVPEMTLAGGALGGLTINGRAVNTDGRYSPIRGGSLAAQFEVRDDIAITAQTRLDAVARDLVDRFQDAGLDSTRGVGDAGFFTDAGGVFDPVDEVGLSSRIAVNARVDPNEGGALWRIRDGLGAALPGEVGASGLIRDLEAALTDERVPASGDFLGAARSASGLSADLLSLAASDHAHVEGALAYHSAEADSLKSMELSEGVDTDQEMQKLMMIEQAYAANARVIQTIGSLLDTLMEL